MTPPTREGTLLTYLQVNALRIVRLSPGECDCLALAADECIRRREVRQDGDAAVCHITLVTYFL